MNQTGPSNSATASLDRLSERQRQCLTLVGDGYTSKQIGRALNLSPSTIDNHLRAAIERLGLDNRIDAARVLKQALNQDLALSSETVGLPGAVGDSVAASLFRLPPIGGTPNRLSQRRRFFHVVQIALLGTMALAAATITIAGIVHLFIR